MVIATSRWCQVGVQPQSESHVELHEVQGCQGLVGLTHVVGAQEEVS